MGPVYNIELSIAEMYPSVKQYNPISNKWKLSSAEKGNKNKI
jgi:hypothetical protein